MNTNNRILRLIAALEVILIFPAALFLIAVVARHIELIGTPAREIALWYAYRFWTLWVFMITLPLVALLVGSVTLLMNGMREERQLRWASFVSPTYVLIIAVSTLATVAILVVVAVHMAAN